ncbi:hypothetical protein ACFY7X_35435, partial [Streptomyces althioticus]
HRCRPADASTVTVDIAHDDPPTGHSVRHRLRDDPESFDDYHRDWNVRAEYVTTLTLPAELCAGLGTDWINALASAQGLEATA